MLKLINPKTDRGRVAIGMTVVALLVAGVTLISVLQLRTATGTARAAGRCQTGDLRACRTAGANIARSCEPSVLARIPPRARARAELDCATIAAAVRMQARQP